MPDGGESFGHLAAALKSARVNLAVVVVPSPDLLDDEKENFNLTLAKFNSLCDLMNAPAADGSIVSEWRRSFTKIESHDMTYRQLMAWNLRAALTSSE